MIADQHSGVSNPPWCSLCIKQHGWREPGGEKRRGGEFNRSIINSSSRPILLGLRKARPRYSLMTLPHAFFIAPFQIDRSKTLVHCSSPWESRGDHRQDKFAKGWPGSWKGDVEGGWSLTALVLSEQPVEDVMLQCRGCFEWLHC